MLELIMSVVPEVPEELPFLKAVCWQTADVKNRLYAIGGPTVKDPNRPAPVPKGMPSSLRKRAGEKRATGGQSSVSNDTATTTLGHQLSLLGLLPDIIAEEVMDIRNELLCYQYV